MSSQNRYPTILIDTAKCVGCRHCADMCFQDVYRFNEEKGYMEAKYPKDCASCYQCELVCPNHCIEIVPAPVQYYDMLERFNNDERYRKYYRIDQKGSGEND